MTAPVVGQVAVELVAEAKGLARSIRAEVESAFRGLDLGAQIREAVGSAGAVHVPVRPDTEPGADTALKEKIERIRPKVRVKVDADRDGGALNQITSLFKNLTPNALGLGAVTSAVQGLFSGLGQLTSLVAPAGSALAGIGSAAGPIGAVAAAVAAAAAAVGGLALAATVAGPALLAAAGAAASIPAALSGLGAIVGTLGLGLRGIGEAFKPKAGGGGVGQVANQARQVAAASRQVEAARRGIAAANRGLENAERSLAQAETNLAQAQAKAKTAQTALSQARIDAVDDIEDLKRSLRSSQLSEEEAAQAVHDALLALNEAKLTGDIPSINRADLAYRRALQTLEDTQDASKDLQKQVDKTNKDGVDGTDRVQQALAAQKQALDDVARAQEGVRDAQNGLIAAQDSLKSATDGLKSAQEGLAAAQTKSFVGAASAASKLIPLAANARRFVDAVKALKPAFEDLRLDVQNRLFAGLDRTVTAMWKAWKDQLHVTLGSFATTINGFLRNLGAGVSKPKFIDDIAAGAEGARKGLASIGKAITDSLVPAFGALSGAAGPFLKSAGDVIADLIRDFGAWITQAEKSGALKEFFASASRAFKSITTTGKLVVKIIGDLFQIITGADPASGKTALDSFNNGLQTVHNFLSDPVNQQQLRDFVKDLKDGLVKFGEAASRVKGFLDRLSGDSGSGSAGAEIGKALVAGILAGIRQAAAAGFQALLQYSIIGRVITFVKDTIPRIAGFFQALPGRIVAFVQSIPARVGAVFSTMSRRAGEIVGYGIGVVSRFFYELPGRIAGFIRSIPDRVSAVWNRIVEIARSLPGRFAAGIDALRGLPDRIRGFFGGLPGKLWSVGQDAIRGLWNGVKSMAGWLRDRVLDFASGVISGFKQGFDSHSPSRRMADEVGVTLPQGISAGLRTGRPALLRDVSRLADDVAAAAVPEVPSVALGVSAGALSAQLQASTQAQLQAQWKPTATGDQLLDALRKLIEFKFNGDPAAALAS